MDATTSKPADSHPPAASATERARLIRQEIIRLGAAARAEHGWLEHQDAIGLGIFVGSISGIVGAAAAYAAGLLPAWAVIPIAAFFMSLLHELEHDLIHRMYFSRNNAVFHLMMAGVWLFRPSTVSPWTRRSWHLHHHKVSGSESDLEERGITNGERWSLRRLLMTGDAMLAVVLRPRTVHQTVLNFIDAQQPATPEERRRLVWQSRLAFFPLGTIHYALLHTFVIVHATLFAAGSLGHPATLSVPLSNALGGLDFVAVVLLLPNALRTFCLHFVSSNIHYYGDIEPGNVIQQTQVWNAWWLFPLQLFCFNFGSTHAIHHFVVREPFYLRQMTASGAHAVMKRHGVRFNDFGTFLRANRWNPVPQESPAASRAMTPATTSRRPSPDIAHVLDPNARVP